MSKEARKASEGPWIAREHINTFQVFCKEQGYEVRENPGLLQGGFQVHHRGHWMTLSWNKSFKRYTADRRLTLVVQSFAATTKAEGSAA